MAAPIRPSRKHRFFIKITISQYHDIDISYIDIDIGKNIFSITSLSNTVNIGPMAPPIPHPSAKAKGPTNVRHHFNRSRHSVDDVHIQVLKFIRAHPDSQDAKILRDECETHWMYQLKRLAPLGINATDGSNHIRSRPNRPRWSGATNQRTLSQSTQSQTNFTN